MAREQRRHSSCLKNFVKRENIYMKLYHKIFKNHSDLSIYLANMDPLIAYDEELLQRLTHANNMDELHEAKLSILTDFFDIYAFDIIDAEFPEPVGYFDGEEEKSDFIRRKILLQDMVRYLGSVYKKYHALIYEMNGKLPEVQLKSLAIDYDEIYRKAVDEYIDSIVNGKLHAVTASFVLPSLIERGLVINLQNRMLYKSIGRLPDKNNLKRVLDDDEEEYLEAFLHNTDSFRFNAKESYVMGKMYTLFVREGVLEKSAENELILTGSGQKGRKKLTRTLGTLLKTDFAKEEILPEYLEIMEAVFGRLNVRNCIMHGLEETFDYLNIGLVAIMFQLLWDVSMCEVFKD